ncbi:lmbr1 domain-containing protein [Lichtheimia hyalospora FSU 10163]|nr:lmbr1 domain-containing protein [Lichtheimia hyalospora FSU 10163]
MSAVVGIAWIVYGILVTGFLGVAVAFTRHYQHKHESEALATIITILALTLVLATVALVPIDIFLVSSTVDQSTGLKRPWATQDIMEQITMTIQIVYYACYGAIGVFSFFVIPFAYFYYEEYDDEEEQSNLDRILGALKYTSFFVVICILLIVAGLFVKPSQEPPTLGLGWLEKLLIGNSGFKSLSFVLACLILAGMVVFIGYTAPGLSLLPLSMIKGRRNVDAEKEDIGSRIAVNRERQREIQARYSGTAKPKNMSDRHELDRLEDERRALTRMLRTIEHDSGTTWYRVMRWLRPLELITGVFLLFLSLAITVSIFLTIFDKINSSICGSSCGYVINHPDLFNPINIIFVKLANVFPLDYIFMVLLIIYFFLSTMSGVITMGVRLLWISLFKIRKGATMPQALLILTILMTLGLLAMNYSLTAVVAPGYAHFGSQVYCNHTVDTIRDCSEHKEFILPCDIYAPTDICTPTTVSTLVDRIAINAPFFGIVLYYAQWAFLVIYAIGLLVALFRKRQNNVDEETENMDADEEQQILLRGESSRRQYGSQNPNSYT